MKSSNQKFPQIQGGQQIFEIDIDGIFDVSVHARGMICLRVTMPIQG